MNSDLRRLRRIVRAKQDVDRNLIKYLDQLALEPDRLTSLLFAIQASSKVEGVITTALFLGYYNTAERWWKKLDKTTNKENAFVRVLARNPW